MALSRFELPSDGPTARDVCLAQRVPTGDPQQVRSVALRSGALAAELRSAARVLLSSADGGLWRGKAQQALADTLRAKAPHLDATAERYESYAAALAGYASTLDIASPQLRWLRGELANRAGVGTTPLGSPSLGPTWTHESAASPGAGHAAGAQALTAQSPAAQAASVELRAYAQRFKAGYDEWADALDRCCTALLRADASDPTRDVHGLAALGRQLDRIAKYAAPIDYMLMHPTLKNASECLGILSTELSVIGFALLFICPPAGAACLTAATVVAAAQLATDVVRRTRGDHVSASTLGLDAMGALPVGGKAFTAGREIGQAAHALEEFAPGVRTISRVVPGGGLAAHEAAGGHTLEKHVGKSEEFLVDRLARVGGPTAASTFHDREIAEESISAVLDASAGEIRQWLKDGGRQLTVHGRTNGAVGSVVSDPKVGLRPCNGIKLILRRNPTLTNGYFILTAMATL